MWGFKPDSSNHDGDRLQAHLLAATEPDCDTVADADSGTRTDTAGHARLDRLHRYHAELDHGAADESGPRCDLAYP